MQSLQGQRTNGFWTKKRVGVTAEGTVASQVNIVPKNATTKEIISKLTSSVRLP
jgi:hypothetical protein